MKTNTENNVQSSSLDDKIKRAELDKLNAEKRKIESEQKSY